MEKKENIVNFDMSTLSLSEMVKVYEDITTFLQFLNEKRILQEERVES